MKLILQGRPEGIGATASQIIVEVALDRRERDRLDPEARCSGGEAVSCAVPGRVAIAQDIELGDDPTMARLLIVLMLLAAVVSATNTVCFYIKNKRSN